MSEAVRRRSAAPFAAAMAAPSTAPRLRRPVAADARRGRDRAVRLPGRSLSTCARPILRALARNAHWSAHGTKSSSRKTLLPCSRGALLQRQGDQVAESAVRHRVLIRKQTVVRIQADVRPTLHRLGQDVGAQPAGQRGRNGLLEEEPDVRRLVRSVTVRGRPGGPGGGTPRGRPWHPRASRPCRSRRPGRSTSRPGAADRRRRRTAAPSSSWPDRCQRMTSSVTGRNRRLGHSAHLMRGFSQMPRTHSFAQAGA